MAIADLKRQLLAVLFASGDPVEAQRLAKLFSVNAEDIGRLVAVINDDLEELPFEVRRLGDSYQLLTKAQYADIIRQALEAKGSAPLSPAALEVLAIVAYNQPVTKAFIEQIRGTDSSSVLSSLVAKGLVEERGRLEIPGRPLSYGTTAAFLRCFGLQDIEALPQVPSPNPQ